MPPRHKHYRRGQRRPTTRHDLMLSWHEGRPARGPFEETERETDEPAAAVAHLRSVAKVQGSQGSSRLCLGPATICTFVESERTAKGPANPSSLLLLAFPVPPPASTASIWMDTKERNHVPVGPTDGRLQNISVSVKSIRVSPGFVFVPAIRAGTVPIPYRCLRKYTHTHTERQRCHRTVPAVNQQ